MDKYEMKFQVNDDMKGFVFTMDAMIALLFAAFIISTQSNFADNVYNPKITAESIAAVHQSSGKDLTSLMEIADVCGKYVIYDKTMNIIKENELCACNESLDMTHTYVYIENDNVYLVKLVICGGKI